MFSLKKWMDQTFYAQYSDNWDNIFFRKNILANLKHDYSILDLGAGAGIVSEMNFKGLTSKVCGIDLDKRVLNNPFLDEAKLASAEKIPYSDNSFNLVFSNNVLEHLNNPLKVFLEVHRVLKNDGVFCIKTPNKYHYVPLIAQLTPHLFHEWINKIRGRIEIDTFKTYYNANTKKDLINIAAKAKLSIDTLNLYEGRPEYLRLHFITYFCGMMYERLVNFSNIFSNLRVIIISTFKKNIS